MTQRDALNLAAMEIANKEMSGDFYNTIDILESHGIFNLTTDEISYLDNLINEYKGV